MKKVLYDNQPIDEVCSQLPLVSKLVNLDLDYLDKKNFIIFPQQLRDSRDLNQDNVIFHQRNGKVWTSNVVGIISDTIDEIRINSRFRNAQGEDFFLQYMIQKVMNYNVVESFHRSNKNSEYYNLLIFLFPYYLNEAMKKGLYKEYVKYDFNDANLKGSIDIPRQIRSNTPFTGKIAYSTREFSYDNRLTQLIRHTIEKIQNEYEFILLKNQETTDNVRLIKESTSRYFELDRLKILQKNIMYPVNHSYYEEYSALQKICIQILSEEKSGFGEDVNEVHGVIIDVAWLWEEYIGKITPWKHFGRKSYLETLHLFQDSFSAPRYPDFVLHHIPVDTKYKKKLDKRNDYNQLVTYIHLLNTNLVGPLKGGFLQPVSNEEKRGYRKIGIVNGLGGELFTYGFYIPQKAKNYLNFTEQIKKEEEKLNFDFLIQ